MPTFKVGDLVKVRLAFWSLVGHKDEIGVILEITPNVVLPLKVDFNGVRIFMSPDTLEKI